MSPVRVSVQCDYIVRIGKKQQQSMWSQGCWAVLIHIHSYCIYSKFYTCVTKLPALQPADHSVILIDKDAHKYVSQPFSLRGTAPSGLSYHYCPCSTVKAGKHTGRVLGCVFLWGVLLISLLLCLLKDTDWCYSASEPFTYLFPRPNSTTCTGGHRRPYMPVFNWLLIDSAMSVGDNKLLPAWEREVADQLSVGVSVFFIDCQICGCIIYT